MEVKEIVLIDAHSLIHRCFHALPPLTRKDGNQVGALYGLANILLKISQQRKPAYALALFDRPEPTFRKEKFEAYKAHRPKAPNELIFQLNEAKNLFKAFSITTLEVPGFEADDLIGTCAEMFSKEKNLVITILTGDLDALQLVKKNIFVETFKTGISTTVRYDTSAVIERYGLSPQQLIDYKALVGDASDNIPGVSGVGQKTATVILKKYKTLDAFFSQGKKERVYEKIIQHKETALLSQTLATIHTKAPIHPTLKDAIFNPLWEIVTDYFETNNFLSLAKRVPQKEIKQKAGDVLEKNPTSTVVPNKEAPCYIGYDIKKEIREGKTVFEPFFDCMIATQLLEISTSSLDDATRTVIKNTPETSSRDELYQELMKRIEKLGLGYVLNNIEIPLIPTVAAMEKRGIMIDRKKLEWVKNEIEKAITQEEGDVKKEIKKEINLNSPKQLLEYFRETLHLPLKSTDADSLHKIQNTHPLPIIEKLLLYRELFKLKTTYIDAFIRLTANDVRIHPTIIQIGAATGRMSCQNPNLQNIPQESAWAKSIRDVFIASPKTTFVAFDYSQIELRVLAHLSKDENMTKAFMDQSDIHSITAQKIFNTPLSNITPTMRRIAKTLNFGMIYGMGSRAFAQTAKVTAAQAKDFIEKYFKEFSGVKKWQNNIIHLARTEGVVTSETGRRRTLPLIHSPNRYLAAEAERMAINMPTQSLGADILKISLIRVNEFIEKERLGQYINLILPIHDELLLEIETSTPHKGEIIKKIATIMESSYTLSVPLKVEIKEGTRWGSMERFTQ